MIAEQYPTLDDAFHNAADFHGELLSNGTAVTATQLGRIGKTHLRQAMGDDPTFRYKHVSDDDAPRYHQTFTVEVAMVIRDDDDGCRVMVSINNTVLLKLPPPRCRLRSGI